MEYLMTYGWAILIIAVVLGVLFQLGVFSSGNFAPRAQPGACQVTRAGTGVTETISLSGECQGLLPEFVATFSSSDYAIVPSSGSLNSFWNGGSWTISAWVYITPTGFVPNGDAVAIENYGCVSGLFYGRGASSYQTYAAEWAVGSSNCGGTVGLSASVQSTQTGSYNAWNFLTADYSNNNFLEACMNGVSTSTPWALGQGMDYATYSPQTVFGSYTCCNAPYDNMKIANVQFYNTSLSATEIQALYVEGIGGAPVRPQNIVAWWPMNENVKDYSGNNNNGQAAAVAYSSSWSSGYTGPQ